VPASRANLFKEEFHLPEVKDEHGNVIHAEWRFVSNRRVLPHNCAVALLYAEAGIAVFPCSADKKPLVKWSTVSTTDEATIHGWFKRWPDSIVGIDCGKSGLIVIDCDRHDNGHDGVEAFAELTFRIP
jgi:hypothetical protein